MKSKNRILYLAHTSEYLYYQTIFSILSLYNHMQGDLEEIQIVVYTDNVKIFKRFLPSVSITYEILSKKQISEFKGNINYVHRIKPCVLQACLDKYKGNILYLDSDTFFLKSPLELLNMISPDVSIMNADEYSMSEAGGYETISWFSLRKTIRENTFTLNGKEISIPFSVRMWNSGVVGLSYEDSYLLDQVISLIDQVYSKSKIFFVEQFALSYILQTTTKLVSSGDFLHHYWSESEKTLLNYYLKLFFKNNKSEPIEELAKKAKEFILYRDKLKMVPSKVSLLSVYKKMELRLRLILKVALYGKI